MVRLDVEECEAAQQHEDWQCGARRRKNRVVQRIVDLIPSHACFSLTELRYSRPPKRQLDFELYILESIGRFLFSCEILIVASSVRIDLDHGLWSAIIRAAGTSVSDTCKRSPTLA